MIWNKPEVVSKDLEFIARFWIQESPTGPAIKTPHVGDRNAWKHFAIVAGFSRIEKIPTDQHRIETVANHSEPKIRR
jgi:hypothetical protein